MQAQGRPRRWIAWLIWAVLLGTQMLMHQPTGSLGKGWLGESLDDAHYAFDHFVVR